MHEKMKKSRSDYFKGGKIHADIEARIQGVQHMDAEAFEKSLRAFAKRAPFRPFVVELVSGSTLLIEHPEALIFRSRVAVYVDKDNEITILDNEGVSNMTTKQSTSSSK